MISLNHLPNQERGEKTILFLRRHWIAVASILGYMLIFLSVPVLIYIVVSFTDLNLLDNQIWQAILLTALSIYLLMVYIITMTQYTDYYLDTWIVTTDRIINIEQRGLFSRIVSTLHLNQVQDVTAETHGFLATMLTYGDVFIQTAGTRERFNFKGVDNPEKVKEEILELVENAKRRHGDASASNPSTEK